MTARDFLTGPMAVVMWSLISALFVFLAAYTWLLVGEVGGIRGVAMATQYTCAAIITGGWGMLLSDQALVPDIWIAIVLTTAWWPLALASAVLADLWAAQMNSHRSFTARSYMAYRRWVERHGEGEENGHSTA